MKLHSNDTRIGLRCVAGLMMLLMASGCATFRDVKQDLNNLATGKKSKKPWQQRDPDDFDFVGSRRPDRVISRDFNWRNLPTTYKVITAMGENQATAQKKYDQGIELYREAISLRDADQPSRAADTFHRAANRFREAAAHWPDSALEQDALYMQGEAFYFADQYVLANRAYEILAARYSGTGYMDHINARRFSIAQFWLQTHERRGWYNRLNWTDKMLPASGMAGEARRIFHQIRLDDPTGKLADDATIALGKAQYKAERWSEAADTFEDLRRSYPGSPFQFEAHLLELNARLASYAGPEYDARPLVEADRLMQAIVRQFPQKLEEHREYLSNQASQIQVMLAQRDLQTGEYYEGRGEYRSASMYYDMVAQRFQETSIGGEAEQRLAEIADKPAEPVQPVAWFVNIFPEAEATKPIIATGTPSSIFK